MQKLITFVSQRKTKIFSSSPYDNSKNARVECHWKFRLEPDLTIPSKVAVALMLKQALSDWERSEYAQTWENVSYCMLGSPHGQLSSLFINRETGLKMRKVWQAVCAAGVWG